MLRQKYHYGDHPSQWGELFIPERHSMHHGGTDGVANVVIVIHGGYWRSQYGAELGEPLARDLAAHGMTAWNLEYRRAGNGGGWPHTFEDVLAGIDYLAEVVDRRGLKLGKVVALGHSAGGHLAVWAAGRRRLPALGVHDAERQLHCHPEEVAVELSGVVSQSGLLNLAEAERLNLSNGAVSNLMGGDSVRFPKRHKFADPMSSLPIDVPVYAVHAMDDEDVPASQSEAYVAASTAHGGSAQLLRVPGDHYSLIDPRAVGYKKCRELIQRMLA